MYINFKLIHSSVLRHQVPMESSINAAIKRGFLQQVRFLIEYGHSVNARDEHARTPLINCALIDDEKWGAGLARLFIEKGGRITARDKRGLNALHYACVHNRKLIVEVYLDALDFDLNIVDKFGNTALHYAASIGSTAICELLIKAHLRYLVPTDIPNRRNETPLLLAWKAGHIECGQLFVDQCQANKEQRDINGVSAEQWYDRSVRKTLAEQDEQRKRDTKKRPRTAMARLQQLSTPKPNHRPTSAPVYAAQKRRNQMLPFKTEKENINADPLQIIRDPQQEFYKPASHKDLRNKPEYVFQLSPADCFVNQARYPMSDISRARSSTHLNHISNSDSGMNSWREAVGSFFTTFDYQFSKSYVKGAMPPEPEPEVNPDDRPNSPTPTHASEPGDSEIGSTSSSKKLSSKKGVIAINAINTMAHAAEKAEKRKGNKVDKAGMMRKISNLQPPGLGSMESSSSESIKAAKKFGKLIGKK